MTHQIDWLPLALVGLAAVLLVALVWAVSRLPRVGQPERDDIIEAEFVAVREDGRLTGRRDVDTYA